MIRYVKQPHANSCGPTAIINAARWAGKNLNMSTDYQRICKDTKFHKNDGTNKFEVDAYMRKNLSNVMKVTKLKMPTPEIINKHLKSGKSAIVCYSYRTKVAPMTYMGHYTLVTDIDSKNRWLAHNEDVELGSVWTSSKKFFSFLKPTVWILSKKNK